MTELKNTELLQREIDFHNQRYDSNSEGRAATGKYYKLKKDFDRRYFEVISTHSKNKKTLELGCGPNINSPGWAHLADECWAIDVSDIAIKQAREQFKGDQDNVFLKVMDAHQIEVEDGYFDVVCGKGILHHLDTEKAFQEIKRVLKPGGIAVFIEPLGHNPLINLYRKFTPQMRSEDEHPLVMNDIHKAKEVFNQVDVTYQHITSLVAAWMPDMLHSLTFTLLNGIDKTLMTLLPFTRRYSWMVLMIMSENSDMNKK